MECMSVCRSWWKYFDKYTLLSHIEIKDNQEQFTAFMDMIKQLPHRKRQIDTLELDNCNVTIPQFHYLVEKWLPVLLRLKLAGAIVQRVGCSLDNHHPLEEFTLDLDRKNPQAFIFKDCERCDTYLCNSESTRLAIWDDIKGLPLMAIRSFRPRRFVVDIQYVIRVVLA